MRLGEAMHAPAKPACQSQQLRVVELISRAKEPPPPAAKSPRRLAERIVGVAHDTVPTVVVAFQPPCIVLAQLVAPGLAASFLRFLPFHSILAPPRFPLYCAGGATGAERRLSTRLVSLPGIRCFIGQSIARCVAA